VQALLSSISILLPREIFLLTSALVHRSNGVHEIMRRQQFCGSYPRYGILGIIYPVPLLFVIILTVTFYTLFSYQGIGDRHTQNILIKESTGELVHIDFGIVFEQGKVLPTPEKIPFRLTRDMIDGMVSGLNILKMCDCTFSSTGTLTSSNF